MCGAVFAHLATATPYPSGRLVHDENVELEGGKKKIHIVRRSISQGNDPHHPKRRHLSDTTQFVYTQLTQPPSGTRTTSP